MIHVNLITAVDRARLAWRRYYERNGYKRRQDPAYQAYMKAYQHERDKTRPKRILTDERRAQINAYHREWHKVRKGRPDYNVKRKEAMLRRKYGISFEQYIQMLANQANRCAICKRDFDDDLKICVDHCHSTRKVRMLLCDACNKGIGTFSENPQWLRQAAEYLERTNHESVTELANAAKC
jgi:hypothetical protein